MPSIPTHDEIAKCAYFRWLDRGCPMDSPEVDWAAAEEELRARETPEGVGLSAPPPADEPRATHRLQRSTGRDRTPRSDL